MARNSGEKYKRLSSALRDNLLKRKEQQRSRRVDCDEEDTPIVDDRFKSKVPVDLKEKN